jgi:hypothetical protein
LRIKEKCGRGRTQRKLTNYSLRGHSRECGKLQEYDKNKDSQICDKISQNNRKFSLSVYSEQLVCVERFA